MHVPQLAYPFICQWTSRLLPCPSYCKQCYNEHWGPVPNPPPHLPPHPIPLGCPSAPALSALFYASNVDWQSVSHMVVYMFQCYSLKLSHPCLLPQSPKVCSLHLCLFCCLCVNVWQKPPQYCKVIGLQLK